MILLQKVHLFYLYLKKQQIKTQLINRLKKNVGEKQNSKWYDNAFSEMKMYQVDYQSIGYYAMWKEILKYIDKEEKIVELGCGPGQFAHMLYDYGYSYMAGYDFSEVAISKAQDRVPDGIFYKEDLENIDIDILTDCADVVIMLEFLEHIDNDIKLIKQISRRMIITLPDFDGTSHVRFFKTMEDVIHRYEPVMNLEHCEKFSNHYLLIGRCR